MAQVMGKFCYTAGKPDPKDCLLGILSAIVELKPEFRAAVGPIHRPNQIMLAYRYKHVSVLLTRKCVEYVTNALRELRISVVLETVAEAQRSASEEGMDRLGRNARACHSCGKEWFDEMCKMQECFLLW
jgi:predicted Zn-ribbon and HTH transcriptional regulator